MRLAPDQSQSTGDKDSAFKTKGLKKQASQYESTGLVIF
jgi:hypothetical protein